MVSTRVPESREPPFVEYMVVVYGAVHPPPSPRNGTPEGISPLPETAVYALVYGRPYTCYEPSIPPPPSRDQRDAPVTQPRVPSE